MLSYLTFSYIDSVSFQDWHEDHLMQGPHYAIFSHMQFQTMAILKDTHKFISLSR